EDRENEGDMIMAAEFATPESIAFFLQHTSGVICVAVTPERAGELDLVPMVHRNTDSRRTAFLVTVDVAVGTTTGISATDRANTIRALIDPATRPADLRRPGHIFPLEAREGGVLKRAGHTEAAVDLARLAGCAPAGVLCEIVSASKADMARRPELERFCEQHELRMISIADLIRHRRSTEKLVRRVGHAPITTTWGAFDCIAFESVLDGGVHLALVKGDPTASPGDAGLLVRVHSECAIGDVFGSNYCDCHRVLDAAMARIDAEGAGVVVYLRGHEGRGLGITHTPDGAAVAGGMLDVEPSSDALEYGVGAQILTDLGVTRMRLMTNNTARYNALEGFGLTILDRVALIIERTAR
ncbi:MAG: 3,4-dihydroxy-2-butanone-4-phosphate synthase, partial [Ilumatobacteraceae bacterium]